MSIKNKFSIVNKSVIQALLFLMLFKSAEAQFDDYFNEGRIYIGVGTAVSSYFGGYFGQAYQMRVLSSSYDDYYDYYGTYSYSNYYDYNYTFWSPIQLDITAGYYLNEYMALEGDVSFLWHPDGRVDPEFKTGSIGNRDYLDRNDYAMLYAVPIALSLKLIGFDGSTSAAFIKAGVAMQYTDEQYDKIREFYSYKGIYEYSTDAYIGTVSKSRWLHGFRVGLGMQYADGFLGGNVELQYSYFNIDPDFSTALALDRAPEAQLFSFKTTVFVMF